MFRTQTLLLMLLTIYWLQACKADTKPQGPSFRISAVSFEIPTLESMEASVRTVTKHYSLEIMPNKGCDGTKFLETKPISSHFVAVKLKANCDYSVMMNLGTKSGLTWNQTTFSNVLNSDAARGDQVSASLLKESKVTFKLNLTMTDYGKQLLEERPASTAPEPLGDGELPPSPEAGKTDMAIEIRLPE